ncbi:MAG: M20 family metallopeptidase [Halanaerobiales bacterium]|nr:M20 family metallopeptidase [Halanaerobiales bacterium]
MSEKINQYILEQEELMIRDLEEIVIIDSGSYDKTGIDQIIDIFKNRYTELGFEVMIDEQSERGNHLVAKRKGNIRKNFLFIGHVDTVFNKGTVSERPFTINGNRAYGPGVCDMKGGVITMYYAIKALLDLEFPHLPDITIILNGDEELGSPSSRSLIETLGKKATFCFVLETGRVGGLVTARKGVGIFEMTVKGVASHAGSNHPLGRNAIEELAHKIIEIHKLTNYERGITLNVGVIEGGNRPNIVPDFAKARIDLRVEKIEDSEEIIAKIQEIAEKVYVEGTETYLNGELNRPPLVRTEKSQKLFKTFKMAGKLVGLEELGEIATGGGSDGNFVSALGVPTIDALGPAGGEAHNDKEYIELASLVQRSQLLAQTIILLTST